MSTVAEIAAAAPTMSTAEALDTLKAELGSDTPRKTAIQAVLDHHLTAIVAAAAEAGVAPAPAGELKALGTLRVRKSGMVVVMTVDDIEEKWTGKTNAQKGYVVDIVGQQADYLAHRSHGNYPISPIPDGVRVKCQNELQARSLADEARRLINREDWNTEVDVYSLGATWVKAIDAHRAGEDGCGFDQILAVKDTGRDEAVTVAVDADGRLVVG
jgi:hypothetical protein